jgi:hypothetical protein
MAKETRRKAPGGPCDRALQHRSCPPRLPPVPYRSRGRDASRQTHVGASPRLCRIALRQALRREGQPSDLGAVS